MISKEIKLAVYNFERNVLQLAHMNKYFKVLFCLQK